MGADERDVDATGDQRFERRVDRRLSETVEPSAFQVRDPRRELKPQQGAECKDVVGLPSTIRVMTTNRHLALVVEQPIEDVQGFACCRGNHLGVERGIAVRDVGVELASWLVAVMGIETGCIATKAACPEELAVRRRGKAGAECRCQWLTLLMVDQALQCHPP